MSRRKFMREHGFKIRAGVEIQREDTKPRYDPAFDIDADYVLLERPYDKHDIERYVEYMSELYDDDDTVYPTRRQMRVIMRHAYYYECGEDTANGRDLNWGNTTSYEVKHVLLIWENIICIPRCRVHYDMAGRAWLEFEQLMTNAYMGFYPLRGLDDVERHNGEVIPPI